MILKLRYIQIYISLFDERYCVISWFRYRVIQLWTDGLLVTAASGPGLPPLIPLLASCSPDGPWYQSTSSTDLALSPYLPRSRTVFTSSTKSYLFHITPYHFYLKHREGSRDVHKLAYIYVTFLTSSLSFGIPKFFLMYIYADRNKILQTLSHNRCHTTYC
jgi:hypothetical protein